MRREKTGGNSSLVLAGAFPYLLNRSSPVELVRLWYADGSSVWSRVEGRSVGPVVDSRSSGEVVSDLELGRGVDLERSGRDRRGSNSSESYQTDEREHGEGMEGEEGREEREKDAVGRKGEEERSSIFSSRKFFSPQNEG